MWKINFTNRGDAMTTTVKKGTGRAAAARKATKAAQSSPRTRKAAPAEIPDVPAAPKLKRMAEGLRPAGWEVNFRLTDTRVIATATRGEETLTGVWEGTAYTMDGSRYRSGKTDRGMRNLSEILRVGGA